MLSDPDKERRHGRELQRIYAEQREALEIVNARRCERVFSPFDIFTIGSGVEFSYSGSAWGMPEARASQDCAITTRERRHGVGQSAGWSDVLRLDALRRHGRACFRSISVTAMEDLEPGLRRTGPLDVDGFRRDAEQAGITTFVLPPVGIVDRASFFDAVRATFPLDPPLVGSRSWDALSDSLCGGLHTLPARRIAILWPGTRGMASRAADDFEMALNVLADVANLLADPRATVGKPKNVAVLVE